MVNKEIQRCIILNAGSATRRAFREGMRDVDCPAMRTKELMLHIGGDGAIAFLNENVPVSFMDAYVFIRLRANDAHFCGMLADYLAHIGAPTNDPIHLSYPQSGEKISQMLKLAIAGIRVPETFVFREESFTKNLDYLKEHLNFPCVYKTDGSKGRNVRRCEHMDELVSLVATKRPHRLALVQPFIENTFDTRTIVAYGEILGTISRTRTNGYLNNIAQGANAARFELSEEEKKVAELAAKACDIDIAGVDMIHTKEGPVILEVNKSPQVGGFESVHDFKVFTRISELIREKHHINPSKDSV